MITKQKVHLVINLRHKCKALLYRRTKIIRLIIVGKSVHNIYVILVTCEKL